jgi:hypothetical protein
MNRPGWHMISGWPAVRVNLPEIKNAGAYPASDTLGMLSLSHDRLCRAAQVSVAVISAMENVLYGHLGGPGGIAAYLDLEGGVDWAELLLESATFSVGSSRCDMVEHRGQWKVLEINATNAGGWIGKATLGTAFAGPLSGEKEYGFAMDTTGMLFHHLYREGVCRGIVAEGEPVQIGMMVSGRSTEEFSGHFLGECEASLQRLRHAHPDFPGLNIQFVKWPELIFSDSGVHSGGRRFHILFETEIVECSSRLLAANAASQGTVLLISGPFAQIANDKRLFAIASELIDASDGGSSAFSALRGAVPWTRCMRDQRTSYRQNEVQLPAFVRSRQSSLVLKRALSANGNGVFIGHVTPVNAWERLVERSLAERDWIVQEWVEPDLKLGMGQHVDATRGMHIVWGAFVIGGSFAGGFGRLLEADGYSPIKNPSVNAEAQPVCHSRNSDTSIPIFPIHWRDAERGIQVSSLRSDSHSRM